MSGVALLCEAMAKAGIARAEYQRHLQSVINQVRSRPK